MMGGGGRAYKNFFFDQNNVSYIYTHFFIHRQLTIGYGMCTITKIKQIMNWTAEFSSSAPASKYNLSYVKSIYYHIQD